MKLITEQKQVHGIVDLNYRKDAPPTRLLIASNGGACVILIGMGPAWDHHLEEMGDDAHYGWDLPPGIWVVEVWGVDCKMWTDLGWEYDIDIDEVSRRPATDDEVKAHARGEYPWDPGLWIDKSELSK